MSTIAPVRAAAPNAQRRPWPVLFGAVLGAVIASLWSYKFVDSVVAGTVMDRLMGEGSASTLHGSVVGGIAFAFASGLAGTLTACNVAVFSTLIPLGGADRGRGRVPWTALGWFLGSAAMVSGLYGAVGALAGTSLPQLSAATIGDGLPVRIVQASVVFVLIGLVLLHLGLAEAGLVTDRIARAESRFAPARIVLLGGLTGAFLIGRPFPLFRELFADAAARRDPFYGATVFIVQSVGNVLVVLVLATVLIHLTRRRPTSWLQRNARVVSIVALVASGAFLVCYWLFRVPSIFGYGWYPAVSWG